MVRVTICTFYEELKPKETWDHTATFWWKQLENPSSHTQSSRRTPQRGKDNFTKNHRRALGQGTGLWGLLTIKREEGRLRESNKERMISWIESFQAFQTSCYISLPMVCPVTYVGIFSHEVAEIVNLKGLCWRWTCLKVCWIISVISQSTFLSFCRVYMRSFMSGVSVLSFQSVFYLCHRTHRNGC